MRIGEYYMKTLFSLVQKGFVRVSEKTRGAVARRYTNLVYHTYKMWLSQVHGKSSIAAVTRFLKDLPVTEAQREKLSIVILKNRGDYDAALMDTIKSGTFSEENKEFVAFVNIASQHLLGWKEKQPLTEGELAQLAETLYTQGGKIGSSGDGASPVLPAAAPIVPNSQLSGGGPSPSVSAAASPAIGSPAVNGVGGGGGGAGPSPSVSAAASPDIGSGSGSGGGSSPSVSAAASPAIGSGSRVLRCVVPRCAYTAESEDVLLIHLQATHMPAVVNAAPPPPAAAVGYSTQPLGLLMPAAAGATGGGGSALIPYHHPTTTASERARSLAAAAPATTTVGSHLQPGLPVGGAATVAPAPLTVDTYLPIPGIAFRGAGGQS
jgi:hypothetical protein